MSGRIVNVRPKPGFVVDGQSIVPSSPVFARDNIVNLLTGRGTSVDRTAHNFWHHMPMNAQQLEAAYRSSWLIAKIVDLPPQDMVREWREWEAEDDEIKKIEAEEARLGIKDAILRGLRYGRFGGGAVLLGTNAADLSQPVRPGEKLLYAKALPRQRLTPGEIDWDVGSENFGQPKWFDLISQGTPDRIHASRLLIFHGEPVPDLTGAHSIDAWWGDSVIERVDRAVKDAQTATGGFSSLIDEAKLDIFRFAGLADLFLQPGGTEKARQRVEATNVGKSIHRAMILDAGDEYEQKQVTWAGMKDLILTYMGIVAGAADIPATRLLGKSPDGMNATGAGDEANYRGMIATKQNMALRPQLAKLDAILLPSLGLKPGLFWKFSPLDTPSEKEFAEIDKLEAETVNSLSLSGLIPTTALEKTVQARMIDSGRWPGLKEGLEEAEREAALEPDGHEGDLLTAEERALREGGDPDLGGRGGSIGSEPSRRAANDSRFFADAAPKTLYVSRKVENAAEIIRWAKAQGFESTLPAADLHVTIAFSRAPVDWFEVGEDWSGDEDARLRIKPGGPRIVERFGDAVVLQFSSEMLDWRHKRIISAGASWDHPEYAPHITISWAVPASFDLEAVEPYTGPIVLGPELFAELDEDWKSKIEEA